MRQSTCRCAAFVESEEKCRRHQVLAPNTQDFLRSCVISYSDDGNDDGNKTPCMSILAGGSHRLLEMLGLQQPVRNHAIITCYYIAVQMFAGMYGFRMGYANGLFFLAHEGFEGMTSLLETLLDWLVLLPTRHQATCNRLGHLRNSLGVAQQAWAAAHHLAPLSAYSEAQVIIIIIIISSSSSSIVASTQQEGTRQGLPLPDPLVEAHMCSHHKACVHTEARPAASCSSDSGALTVNGGLPFMAAACLPARLPARLLPIPRAFPQLSRHQPICHSAAMVRRGHASVCHL
jgi:hypothetical protein